MFLAEIVVLDKNMTVEFLRSYFTAKSLKANKTKNNQSYFVQRKIKPF